MTASDGHQPLTDAEVDALIQRATTEVADPSVPPRPKLSVLIVTFNHAQFIGQTLDGVLMQKVNFPYEIVVGEDHSTDGTTEMVLDYQKRHPDKIRVLLAGENLGRHTGNGRFNFIRTLRACRGDYLAMLEGDDYWTDPEKLQLQADYLDQNDGCALCHHKVNYVAWPGGNIVREFPPPRYRTPRLDSRTLAMFSCVQTCSVVFRRKWLPPLDSEFRSLKMGDWPLFVLLNQRGWIGYLDRNMAAYRVHAGNRWNSQTTEWRLQAAATMAEYLLERVNDSSRDIWKDTILAIAFKDIVLAARSLSPGKFLSKLAYFARRCFEFRKPFWIFTRLWAYGSAHYFTG